MCVCVCVCVCVCAGMCVCMGELVVVCLLRRSVQCEVFLLVLVCYWVGGCVCFCVEVGMWDCVWFCGCGDVYVCVCG